MKTLRKDCKCATVILACTVLLLGLCACGQTESTPITAEEASGFCCAKDDCFLCGAHEDYLHARYFGQNNVGIISLNSFELLPVEINRYDDVGRLMEENTGAMQMRLFKSNSDGFSATLWLEPDRGIANLSMTPGADRQPDLRQTASHLCKDCFQSLALELDKAAWGVGILNLQDRSIQPLRGSVTGFGSGDYYIYCDYGEQPHMLIVLTPPRYAEAVISRND